MINSRDRKITYSVTVAHYIIISIVNYIFYAFIGIDGILETKGVYLLSLFYYAFLIVYAIKHRKRSLIPRNLVLDVLLWSLQFGCLCLEIYFPPSRFNSHFFYGLGFGLTSLAYIVFEGAAVILYLFFMWLLTDPKIK